MVLQDANYNVCAIANTTGVCLERYNYTSYGEPNCLTPAFADRASTDYDWDILYTGRQYDAETGLYQYRNRYYHPQLGRFINRDPRGYWAGDANLYRYVRNNSVIYVDPSGLEWQPSKPLAEFMLDQCSGPCGPCDNFDMQQGWKALEDGLTLTSQVKGLKPSQFIRPQDINADGSIANDQLTTALHHCIASGMLAKYTSGACSQCIGDNREIFQYQYGADPSQPANTQQSIADTMKGIYNNREGRLCAGCRGDEGQFNPPCIRTRCTNASHLWWWKNQQRMIGRRRSRL